MKKLPTFKWTSALIRDLIPTTLCSMKQSVTKLPWDTMESMICKRKIFSDPEVEKTDEEEEYGSLFPSYRWKDSRSEQAYLAVVDLWRWQVPSRCVDRLRSIVETKPWGLKHRKKQVKFFRHWLLSEILKDRMLPIICFLRVLWGQGWPRRRIWSSQYLPSNR